eukprot:TRINITY_DN11314_c0_g1_i1.p1 TRINITY_DN11314_c0_g1~~TRINITY_DN11314_c0_g1_i1.p1  ORF type:complete len:67 (+),score=8.14 TRINITY_DN11314_c0_g1_i1:257-457(+)
MDTGFSPSVIACFTAISIPSSLVEAVLLLLTTLFSFQREEIFMLDSLLVFSLAVTLTIMVIFFSST